MTLSFEQKKPLMIFSLKLGETFNYSDKEHIQYKISSSEFLKHDHKNKPIYHLDYPLQSDDDTTGIVITVECSSDELLSPYACKVEKYWTVFRKNIILKFELDNDTGITECRIYKKDKHTRVLGFKADDYETYQKMIQTIYS